MRLAWSRGWDFLLAGAGATALLIEGTVRANGALAPAAYVLAILAAAPIGWRSRAPLAMLFTVEAGAIVCVFDFDANLAATAIVAVMLFTVALHGDRQRSLLVGAVTALAVAAMILILDGAPDLGGFAGHLSLVLVSLVLGDMIRLRRALRAAALQRAAHATREREQDSRRRVTNERLRIARELHDTLAHALVAINVRAGVANHLHESSDPAALKDIQEVSATALGDLRATLRLLRESDDTAPTEPVFDLGALPRLADHARAAGLNADFDVQINGTAIPSAVGQAAFRIVQEALTNVLRHADASGARVRVRALAEALDVEVVDDGRSDSSHATGGYGLIGMSERAAALGGRVHTGPADDGGWRVHAVLPISGEGQG